MSAPPTTVPKQVRGSVALPLILESGFLSDILPTLLQGQLMRPASPGFGVVARDAHRI